MTQYKYLRGSQDSREAVEFDITRRGQYITTCVVDVDLLLCGIKAFPCGNGDDVKLTPEQQFAILETVQQERKRITDSYPVKTYEGWRESGLPLFEDYCFPGDTVDEAMVEHFVNSVPPVLMLSFCTQAGGAVQSRGRRARSIQAHLHHVPRPWRRLLAVRWLLLLQGEHEPLHPEIPP